MPIKQVEGTGYTTRHGYRVVPIPRDESVHHRNGDRLDNRPENLELWSRYQPKGQRVSDKVEYAIELLQRYLPDALASQLPLVP